MQEIIPAWPPSFLSNVLIVSQSRPGTDTSKILIWFFNPANNFVPEGLNAKLLAATSSSKKKGDQQFKFENNIAVILVKFN